MTCGFASPEIPSPRQILAIALWLRAGCTSDVARALVGVSATAFERWIMRGREDYAAGIESPFSILLAKLDLVDALRRGEIQRAVHAHMTRNPERALEYLDRRWPDGFDDRNAGGEAEPSAAGTLVDLVLDVAARVEVSIRGEGDPRQAITAGAEATRVVDDESPDAPDR